jgi:hypothetical protein
LNFTKHEEKNCFTVEPTLRNHPPQKPFVVRWEYPLFIVETLLDPAKLHKLGRPMEHSADEVLELFDEPILTTKQIVQAAKEELLMDERRTYEKLKELVGSSKLRKPRRGQYERIQ